ncbi:MAG: hypothetical protein GC204_02430 [Chloroflexi bacterium]|nr:hypothetical protein [Chloroflexota bacterium]
MRTRKGDRRFSEVMLGLLLILVGIIAFGGSQILLMGLGVVGLYLVLRQFDRSSNAVRLARDLPDIDEDDEVITAPPRVDQVYAHALDAVRAAGLDPNETHVLPIDIGVMAFNGDQEPIIYRTRPVLDDIDYLQPFVQLRLPTRARGRIRFEIIDSDGQTLFVHEEDHEFERGRNLVTPAARLPIHDAHALQDAWELRVSADGVLIAEHRFEWEESTTKVIRRHLKEDGELSNEVRAMMAENRLQRMSLDELLEPQDTDNSANERQQSRR